MTKVYNDSVFGGITWSHDEKKICFIGEVPDPASFKNPWENKKADEEEKKGEEKKDEDKKEEHWQDEKFIHNRDFGEMLVNKKNPAIFVFDLALNKLE